ncbi:MAG: hypothetical protein DMG06_30670, partial [Acidobacteria bacterium]
VINNDVVTPFRITDTKLMSGVLVDERAVGPQCVDETVQPGKAVKSFPRIIAVIIVAHLEQEFYDRRQQLEKADKDALELRHIPRPCDESQATGPVGLLVEKRPRSIIVPGGLWHRDHKIRNRFGTSG